MENLSDKIKYFQTLEEDSVSKTSTLKKISKLKIPEIFVANDPGLKVAPKENNEDNKLVNLDKNISFSDCNLNLVGSDPQPIFKSQSQSVLVDHVKDNILVEETEKRDSGLHKSKGYDDLPLATLKNETIHQKDKKLKICNVVPKKIEITIIDDIKIDFHKRAKHLNITRPLSLNFDDPKTARKVNQESLYTEKLNEIKSKRRNIDYDVPRTYYFNFTGKNKDRSQSACNLTTISDETLAENPRMSSEDVSGGEFKKGLKIVPKEMKLRNMQENNTQEEVNTTNNIKEVEDTYVEETVSPIKQELNTQDEMEPDTEETPPIATPLNTHVSHEEEMRPDTKETPPTLTPLNIHVSHEEAHDEMDSETNESPPIPAPRGVPSPNPAQNHLHIVSNDLELVKIEPFNNITPTAFENEDYMSKKDLEFSENTHEIPKPAPRRQLSSTLEEDSTNSTTVENI